MENLSIRNWACVPFPAPGAPNKIIRMNDSLRLNARGVAQRFLSKSTNDWDREPYTRP